MKNFYILLYSCFTFGGFAQLSVFTGASATLLAQKIAGAGVVVTNVNLNCGAGASGTFTYSGPNLGIPNGIILTTGAATDPAHAESYFCNVQNGNNFSDPDLTTIEPNVTNDVCLLEFDVVPTYNNLNVTYVFGSEEYPTFVNQFNDAFGFFLTGPNPSGGTYSGTNVGTLPNGTPVSINNVNAGVNSSYFVDNYNIHDADIAYAGFTIPVTSSVSVIAGSTYHMKIAVGDALDEAYDSGIFIQDSLFMSKAPLGITGFAAKNISCSPNPAHDIINFTLPSLAQVEVFNCIGEKVTAEFNFAERTLDVHSLANGFYSAVLTDKAGNIFTAKFIRE